MSVHDDEVLARFYADHNILDDVLINRPCLNNDANWVKEEGNHIPIWTWLIHKANLKFPLSQLLKKVMALSCLTFHASICKFLLNSTSDGRSNDERGEGIRC